MSKHRGAPTLDLILTRTHNDNDNNNDNGNDDDDNNNTNSSYSNNNSHNNRKNHKSVYELMTKTGVALPCRANTPHQCRAASPAGFKKEEE